MGSWCLILFALTAGLAVLPQTTKPPSPLEHPGGKEVWASNFPRAPLEIKVEGDRSYTLNNKSKVAIKSYRLGCVRESTKKNVVIVYRMPPEEITIAPGESWGIMGFHHNADKTECERKSAKVAVVEVDFEDGTVWQAPAELQELGKGNS